MMINDENTHVYNHMIDVIFLLQVWQPRMCSVCRGVYTGEYNTSFLLCAILLMA